MYIYIDYLIPFLKTIRFFGRLGCAFLRILVDIQWILHGEVIMDHQC